jgi:hypothetical protein
MHQMALAIVIPLLVGTIFLVLRFVRSRFLTSSDLDDSDISDSDEPEDGNWLDDPHSGSPALLKGGPKKKITAAEAEEPES